MQLQPKESAPLYGLIGRCLVLEIDAALIEVLRDPAMASTLGKLEPRLESYVHREWQANDYDEVAAEYCALFVLPKGVTQTASYWIPGSTEDIGHSLVAGVAQVLDTFGLQIETPAMGNVPKDNVALLALLAAQLYQEDLATGTGHGDEFVKNFVTPWAPAFCDALLAKTGNPVYRAIACLLAQLTSRE